MLDIRETQPKEGGVAHALVHVNGFELPDNLKEQPGPGDPKTHKHRTIWLPTAGSQGPSIIASPGQIESQVGADAVPPPLPSKEQPDSGV